MMLTNEQLWSIPINPTAMELTYEAVVREETVLPVGVDGDELRLVLPAIADPKLLELEEKLRFILERRFTYDTADGAELARVVDFHYTAVYSSVQNCDRMFQFRCPQEWATLQATDAPLVRWCDVCQRTVTYCRTDEELDRLSRAGECVAFYDNLMIEMTMGALVVEEEE